MFLWQRADGERPVSRSLSIDGVGPPESKRASSRAGTENGQVLPAGRLFVTAWLVAPALTVQDATGINDRPRTSGDYGSSSRNSFNLKPVWTYRYLLPELNAAASCP